MLDVERLISMMQKQAGNLIVVLAPDPSEQDNNVKVTVFNVNPENGHSREGRSTVVFTYISADNRKQPHI
jgi:hypothetical protein